MGLGCTGPMNPRIAATAAALLLAASTLASCTAPEPEPAASPAGTDAEDVCAQFGDVETIIGNAGSALRDGRMQQQEYDGWLRVAARVLSRIPADTDDAIGAAIVAAQDAAPATPIGIVGEGFDPLSAEWAAASLAVHGACEAEGVPVVGEGFTGG